MAILGVHESLAAMRRRDEMADMPDSKSGGWQRPCRFKSDRRQRVRADMMDLERHPFLKKSDR